MFPKQTEYSLNGYLLLLAVFIISFVVLKISNRKSEQKFSFSMTVFLAFFCVLAFQAAFESWIYHTYYIRLFNSDPVVLLYILALLWLTLGLYIFIITIGYALYKFYVHREITDFMWEIIKFVEDVKAVTKQ